MLLFYQITLLENVFIGVQQIYMPTGQLQPQNVLLLVLRIIMLIIAPEQVFVYKHVQLILGNLVMLLAGKMFVWIFVHLLAFLEIKQDLDYVKLLAQVLILLKMILKDYAF